MPYVTCSSIEIYYEEKGAGQPLLLIPGLGCDCRVWGGVISRLAREYRVIMPDPRGVGRSKYDGKPFTFTQIAADFAEFMQELGVQNPVICGHSMGGQIAMQLACDYPGLAQRLVLVCTDCAIAADVKTVIGDWARERVDNGCTEAWLRDVYRWMVTDKYYQSPLLDSAVKYGMANPAFSSDEDFYRQYLALENFDIRNRLADVDIPVLIIAGREDQLFPLNRQEAMAAALKKSELSVLDECAHSPLMECGGEFVRLLLEADRR